MKNQNQNQTQMKKEVSIYLSAKVNENLTQNTAGEFALPIECVTNLHFALRNGKWVSWSELEQQGVVTPISVLEDQINKMKEQMATEGKTLDTSSTTLAFADMIGFVSEEMMSDVFVVAIQNEPNITKETLVGFDVYYTI